MPRFGKLFWLNTLCFGCFAAIHLLEALFGRASWLEIPKGIIILSIAFPLFGINATIILEKIFKDYFDTLERVNISLAIAFIFPALLLTIESSSGILFPELPLLNTALLFLVAVWLHPHALHKPFDIKTTLRSRIFQSGILACTFYIFLTTIIVLAYPALPDSDPYYWLLKIRKEIEVHALASLQYYRPLFSSLVYIFHKTGGLDIYTLFKYVLPFLTILMVLPAALIARLFPPQIHQITLFLLPLSSASLILYSEMPIPQSILNIILAFFIFFVLHAYFSKKKFFYFLAGGLMVPMYYYHEAAILIFLVWFCVTIIWYRVEIRTNITKNPLLWILLSILILSKSEYLFLIIGFVKNWLIRMTQAMTVWHTNLSFPLSYVNVDGNSVGWGNGIGILKYYTFYVGPAVLVVLGSLLLFLSQNKLIEERSWYKKKELLVLGFSFCLFFTLAEVLPRILNVAFLPERSWGFAGLFLLAATPVILKYSTPKRAQLISLLLMGALFMNSLAALYVNSLKQYLLSPSVIPSTQWITSNLPKQSIVITQKNWSILSTYTSLEIIDAQDSRFYQDQTVFDSILRRLSFERCFSRKNFKSETFSNITTSLEAIRSNYSTLSPQEFSHALNQLTGQISSLKTLAPIEGTPTTTCSSIKNIYVYYSQENPKNPYSNRPYTTRSTVPLGTPLFDLYPEQFHRVFTAGTDEVIIWKVVQ